MEQFFGNESNEVKEGYTIRTGRATKYGYYRDEHNDKEGFRLLTGSMWDGVSIPPEPVSSLLLESSRCLDALASNIVSVCGQQIFGSLRCRWIVMF